MLAGDGATDGKGGVDDLGERRLGAFAGGVIAVDNVLANGEAVTQETEFGGMMDRFNEKVARDERVDVLMLPFRDGVTLAVKRG